MSLLVDLRDEVYLRIATKIGTFVNNNTFQLVETWRPWTHLEDLNKLTGGKVYVIGVRPDTVFNASRDNLAPRDYPIMIGYQQGLDNPDNLAAIDSYVGFVEELEDLCRLGVDPYLYNMSFTRLEPLRDNDNLPLSFLMLRDILVFEAYFTAYYTSVLPGRSQTCY